MTPEEQVKTYILIETAKLKLRRLSERLVAQRKVIEAKLTILRRRLTIAKSS